MNKTWAVLAGVAVAATIAVAVIVKISVTSEPEKAAAPAVVQTKPVLDEATFKTECAKAEKLKDSGDVEGAIRAFENIKSDEPSRADVLIMLGELYITKKDYEKAYDNLYRALSMDPQKAWTLRIMGCLYREKGKYKEAEDYFQKAIKAGSAVDITWINYDLGKMFAKKGDVKEARRYMQKALDSDPKNDYLKSELASIKG